MKINDYAYIILPEKTVVIDGGSSGAVYEGVVRFCSDILFYADGQATSDKLPVLAEGTSYTCTGTYENKKVTVNGIPLQDFKISVKNRNGLEYADRLVAELGKYNGYSVPVVTSGNLTEEDRGAICLGTFDRVRTNSLSASYNGYRVVVSHKDGYTAGIIGSSEAYYKQAVNSFLERIEVSDTSDGVIITLPTETYQEYKYDFTESVTTKWTKDESKTVTEKVAEGLTYKEYCYTDGKGNPHVANVLYVDTTRYSFCLGLPEEGVSYQTVAAQMKNAEAEGKAVVAGINGDRWDTWKLTYQLHGLTVKDGKVITKGMYDNPYLALDNSGEYVIGTNGWSANTSKYSMCIGGDYLLVSRAVPQHFSDIATNSHLYSSHPRAMVGITDDGDLVLVTVDGRQSHSSGATMENAADLMASLGCYMAVSLDGGGSAEMVVKYGSEYVTKNSPSDGKSRGVKNSVLIMEKQ